MLQTDTFTHARQFSVQYMHVYLHAHMYSFTQYAYSGAEVYVNDAFGTAHRAHASTAGVTDFVQGPKVAGFLLEKEILYLDGAIKAPKRPLTAIVGTNI